MNSNSMRNKIRIFYAAILYHVAGRHKSARLCWRMLLATALLFLSACSTAGTGNVNAEITPDRASASLKFGANMSGPWKGRVELKRSITESSVKIIGEGSDVDRTPGHEATKEMVKDGAAVTDSLARRRFVPGL